MMLARALTLSTCGLRRIARSRALVAALVALPVVCGVAGLVLGSAAFAWVGPVLCASLAAAILGVQRSVDDTTGLSAALRCSPLGTNGLTLSRGITALALLVPQVVILIAIARCGA